MRAALAFSGVSAAVAIAVGLLGTSMVPASAQVGVWAGAVAGLVGQVVLFFGLFVGVSPDGRLNAHLVGMLGRLVLLGVAALVWVPRAGLPAAPTLFALVTVFFVTTLVESVLVQSKNP